jgi:hypothetical protein
MAGYTREFLVCAFADKYRACSKTEEYFLDFKIRMGYFFYDDLIVEHGTTKGKAIFRERCSLDAEAIKKYKEGLK